DRLEERAVRNSFAKDLSCGGDRRLSIVSLNDQVQFWFYITGLKGQIYLIRIGFTQVCEFCILYNAHYFVWSELSLVIGAIEIRANCIPSRKEVLCSRAIQNAYFMLRALVICSKTAALKNSRTHLFKVESADSIA